MKLNEQQRELLFNQCKELGIHSALFQNEMEITPDMIKNFLDELDANLRIVMLKHHRLRHNVLSDTLENMW